MKAYYFKREDRQTVFASNEEDARAILRERDPLHEAEYELMDVTSAD